MTQAASPPRSSAPSVPASEEKSWRELYQFYTNFSGMIAERYRSHGRVFRVSPFRDMILMLGADANQFVLVKNPKLFSARLAWHNNIGVLFKDGLLNHDGAEHRHLRRLLVPAFRQEALYSYLEQAEPIIDQHLARWPAHCPDIYPLLKALTLHVANRVFFGIESDADLQTYNRLMTDVVGGTISFVKVPVLGRNYQKALRARRELIKMLTPLVRERRAHPTSDMTGQLCRSKDEDGSVLSDEDIINQMLFVMMAAHDTTASTLTSLFYELSMHPEWQLKLRDEAQEINAQSLPLAELPEHFKLHHYVIKETLRLNTPLKVIPRVSTEAFTFENFQIDAGQLISLCPAFSHYMEEYWTAPQSFDPLRFSPERAEHKTHPYAYAPFGGGLHMCLGQFFAEKFVSVIIYKVLQRFSWQLPKGKTVHFQQVPIQVPKGKMPLVFQKL